MTNLIINIHGFLSSHESEKVVAFRQRIEQYQDVDFISPCLPNNPQSAIETIERLITDNRASYQKIALIGHSLGGYYATYLGSKYGLRAVLVNPVVRGYGIMCEFFGASINPHTGEPFEIGERDIAYLFQIHLETLPDNSLFLVMQQLDDEILDPQEALAYYAECEQLVEDGGCHDFVGFARHSQRIMIFLFPLAAEQHNQNNKEN